MITLFLQNLLFGYFIGSIPFGLILCKIFSYGDIRNIGSGNIGATNVLRTGNKILALATLILDSGKGAIAVLLSTIGYSLSSYYFPESNPLKIEFVSIITGLGAILGHTFPIWLKFKGGKGVATAAGVLLAAVPFTGLAACVIWLLSALIFRISSLAALIATAIAPFVTLFVYGKAPALITLLIAALVFMRHKDNIKRLIKGEEPKIGKKKKKESTE